MLKPNISKQINIAALFLVTLSSFSCKKDNNVIPGSGAKLTIHISKWLDGASSAITFQWDDINENHYKQVAPIFNLFNYHTSFAVNTYPLLVSTDYIQGYKTIISAGHEICSHSKNHKGLEQLTQDDIMYELTASKEAIIKYLGVVPTTYVHPNNRTNDYYNNLLLKYYLFSRIYNPEQDSANFIANLSIGTDYNRLLYTYQVGLKTKNWVVFAGHGLDDAGYEPIKSKDLIDFLTYIKTQTDSWVDTYQRVAIYNEVRLKIKDTSVKGDTIVVNDSKVNYARYAPFKVPEIPITLEIPDINPLLHFTGKNIIKNRYANSVYYITIDLLKGNKFEYSNSKG